MFELAAVPRHMIEGVPTGGDGVVEIASDVACLKDVISAHADRPGDKMIDRGAAVGVDIIDQKVFAAAPVRRSRIESVDQLTGLFRR